MHAFLFYSYTTSQFSHSIFFLIYHKGNRLTIINALFIYLYICDRKKVSTRSVRDTMYIQAIRVPGSVNAGSNGVALIYPAIAAWKVRVVISSQCYGRCSEMNVRIAHMARVTIGLTSHAFIIDVVVRCSLLHCDRRRYIARQTP